LLFGKQLPFWGGFFGTFEAHFDRPGALNTPHRKVVVHEREVLSFSIGQKTILMFLASSPAGYIVGSGTVRFKTGLGTDPDDAAADRWDSHWRTV
jgi:hypothetical protein